MASAENGFIKEEVAVRLMATRLIVVFLLSTAAACQDEWPRVACEALAGAGLCFASKVLNGTWCPATCKSTSCLTSTTTTTTTITTTTMETRAAAPLDFSAILDLHNDLRRRHGAADLHWSIRLQETARAVAQKCKFRHSGLGNGENLFALVGQVPADLGVQATRAWYAEKDRYSFANPGFSPRTGHFTQVVWKSTRQLGCWEEKSCRTLEPGPFLSSLRGAQLGFVVCEYFPPGNALWAFPDNVVDTHH